MNCKFSVFALNEMWFCKNASKERSERSWYCVISKSHYVLSLKFKLLSNLKFQICSRKTSILFRRKQNLLLSLSDFSNPTQFLRLHTSFFKYTRFVRRLSPASTNLGRIFLQNQLNRCGGVFTEQQRNFELAIINYLKKV